MRKLRDDIMLKEAREWADGMSEPMSALWGLTVRQHAGMGGVNYPDSFYEAPPLECFGKFSHPTTGDRNAVIYGWRCAIHGWWQKCRWDDRQWGTFIPGLPSDVDENGYPKLVDKGV